MPDGNSPSDRLLDEDAQAYQVRAFLRSIQPLTGNSVTRDDQAGRDLIADYVLTLATGGDNSRHPLTVAEVAQVLSYLGSVEPRPGVEDHAAGGNAMCGHLLVMQWLAKELHEAS